MPSSISSVGVNAKPSASSRSPVISSSSAEVCTVSDTSRCRSAPRYRATVTFTPLPMPIMKPVNSDTRIVVEPTAPRASAPAKRPTTAMSDMLNSTCSTLESISGRLKRTMDGNSGPSVRDRLRELNMAVNPFRVP